MGKFLNILVVVLISVALTGCGAHFVASDKTLGIPPDKKPVVGVLVTGFVLNHEGNPVGPILGARYGEEVTQFLKDQGIDAKIIKLSETQTHRQLAGTVSKYNSLTDYRKRFPADFTFVDMTSDFNDLGIDMLVILSGSAGNASIPAWVQVSTLVAFGTMGLRTPSSETIATAVSRSGKPLYNDCTTFTRMGRRDFGDDSHRKAMAEAVAVAGGIRSNSF